MWDGFYGVAEFLLEQSFTLLLALIFKIWQSLGFFAQPLPLRLLPY